MARGLCNRAFFMLETNNRKSSVIVNNNGSINALEWIHEKKKFWITYHNESTGKRALQHLDEIECEDGRKGMFPRSKLNERFKGAEITKYFVPVNSVKRRR